VVFTPGAAALSYHETPEQKADWWLEFITERLNREAPVPADMKEREYLLYRVVRELFGTAPSTTEGDAFAADKSPDALKNLAALLAKHPYGKRSDGVIHAGSTNFRVLPPDADADKRPRVATGPGSYSLGDGVYFFVTQRAASNSVRNEASIAYYQQGKDAVVHNVPLPYGHDRWAAATMKGAKELWVAEFGTLRKYDFANPLQPAETRYEGGTLGDAPISKELLAALEPVLSKPAVAPKPKHPGPPPASAPATEKPKGADAPGAAAPVMRPKSATVEVGKDGSLRLDGQAFTLDALKAAAAEQSGRAFVIRADKDTPFAKVQEVVEVLKNAGVKEVTFANAQAAKLTPEGLLGTWRGMIGERGLMLSFHRPPVETDVQLDLYVGGATIGTPAAFTIAEDSHWATVTIGSGTGQAFYGTLYPAGLAKLRLKLSDEADASPERGGISLTRDAEAPATEPQQKEARELFEMWKTTANDDGTIPGTFIGALATEVRAYVKAKPTYDSAEKLPKLLPRFVTSRNWTQAEAIKLLDDVAYYATEPIEARVAKAKLPSGALWRTMVEFQDIPVHIAKWSEAKDGLRIGMRAVGGKWSAGGSVRVELWLHNPGGKAVSFYSSRPNRQDAGVAVAAIGADGREIPAETVSVLITEVFQHCTLPAGHVAMAKEFDVTFGKPDSGQKAGFGPRFHALSPGNYQLRCKWQAEYGTPKPGDWTGELTAPDFAFTLGGTTAAAGDSRPEDTNNPQARARDEWSAAFLAHCKTVAEARALVQWQPDDVIAWGPDGGGLRSGVVIAPRVPLGGRLPTWLVLRNFSKEPKNMRLVWSWNATEVAARDADGKALNVRNIQLFGVDAIFPVTLEPNEQVEMPGPPVEFGGAGDKEIACRIETEPGNVLVKFDLAGLPGPETGEVAITVTAAAAADEAKPAPKVAKLPDESYATVGVPIGDVEASMEWSGIEQDGLCLGMRFAEDAEWRIGGEVKVELWACSSGEKEVKFQHIEQSDIGLRVFLKGADGKEHEAGIAPFAGSPVFSRALPAGHIFKVKEFPVVLLPPGGKHDGAEPHFTLPAGDYKFRCEVKLPGTTGADAEGKQVTPAEGEWSGTLKSGEIGVQLVAADAPKAAQPKNPGAPMPGAVPRGLSAEVKPERARLSNDTYTAVAFQSETDVNFVLVYQGALSTGLTETWSETTKRWSIEGNVHLVDHEKTQATGKNVDKRVVAVKYTSDEPNTLYLDGKAYDLAASPRLTPMGALVEPPARVFLLRDEGEPFQTQRTSALRDEKDLATIGQFAVHDHFTAGLYAESRRIEQMDGWVLAWDFQVPQRRSGGHRIARLRIFPDGQVLSLPDGRTLNKLTISTEEVTDFLRWLAEDQKVPALESQAAQPGDPKPGIAQEFDTWAGGVTFLQFKHDGKWHAMTVGSHLRNPGTGKELPNPGHAAFKAIGERLSELENKAAKAPGDSGR
ncbi:MAG: ExbD/TolR family protein, partial [Verrucomicrobiales bacterium]